MFRLLLSLIIFSVVSYFLNRFLQALLSPRPPEKTATNTGKGSDLVQDPSCLSYLPKENAFKASWHGETHYFCSPGCAATFEKKMAEESKGK